MTEAEELELLELEEQEANAGVPGIEPEENVPTKSVIAAALKQAPSTAKAAAMSGANVLSFGHSPKLIEKMGGGTKAEQEQFLAEHPMGNMLGTGAGLMGSMLIPLPNVVAASKAAQVASKLGVSAETAARLIRVADSAVVGGGMGALQQADTPEQRMENVKFGGLLGVLPTAAIESSQAFLGRGGRAAESVLKAAGITSDQLDKMSKKQKAELSKWMLDKKLLGKTLPNSVRGIEAAANKVKGKAGEAIGDTINNLDTIVDGKRIINRNDVASDAMGRVKLNPQNRNFPEEQKELTKHFYEMTEAGHMPKGGDLSPAEAQQLKIDLDQREINWDKNPDVAKREGIAVLADKAERAALAEKLEKAMKEKNAKDFPAYMAAKDDFGKATEVAKTSSKALNKSVAARIGSAGVAGVGAYGLARLGENIVGEREGGSMAPAIGAATLGLGLLGTYGPAAYARTLNAQKNPNNTAYTGNAIWSLLKKKQEEEQAQSQEQ